MQLWCPRFHGFLSKKIVDICHQLVVIHLIQYFVMKASDSRQVELVTTYQFDGDVLVVVQIFA